MKKNHLGRRTNVAKALYRGLILEVLDHGSIETTLAKAKSVQGDIDKLINWAKEGTVNARRLTVKTIKTDRFFDKYAKSFSGRNSGYTRTIRLGQRLSDAAEKVIFELVEKTAEPVKAELVIPATKNELAGPQTKQEVKKPVKKTTKKNVKNN